MIVENPRPFLPSCNLNFSKPWGGSGEGEGVEQVFHYI